MRRHTWMQWLLINASAALLLQGVTVGTASADDDAEVARRLGKHGKLSPAEIRKVTSAVSKRMKRAANMTNDDDPLRMAVSQALYGAPIAGDAMKAAKVRLRLYAGLNGWALDNLFAPRPGAIANCTSQFGLSRSECQALVAASGQIALAEASRQGGGMPVASRPAAAPYRGAAPARFQQPSRFGRFNSGYRPPAQPVRRVQPAYGARPARPMAQPAWTAQRPSPVARPMRPAARPMARPSTPSPQELAARKAAYQRRRQAYLERKRKEMEARKSKVVAVAAGERIQRGPASREEAEAAGLDPSDVPAESRAPKAAVASKPADKASPAAKRAPAEEVAQAPAEAAPDKKEKPALDSSFLEGLMDDPLGKN